VAKKKQEPKVEARTEALRHNPFAALARGVEQPPAEAVEAKATEAPPEPVEAARAVPRLTAKLVVRRETKGRGGKTVTRISGLPPEHLEDLAARMKKALGCGAVVEGAELLLLGSLVPRAAAWLRAEGATRVVEGN
jgi:translation initiation factor 1